MINNKMTIKDMARICEVSTATVSLVLNGKDSRISSTTRARVLKAAKEYEYIPNRIASALVTKTTKSIGLVVPDITNPFFPELARGVEDYAHSMGISVILCNSDNQFDKENLYITTLQEKMIDGIIISPSGIRSEHDNTIDSIPVPTVIVDRCQEVSSGVGCVDIDNKKGGYLATTYLLQCGYTKVLYISGSQQMHTAQRRYDGYLLAHRDRGIVPPHDHIFAGEYSSSWGYEAVCQAISRGIQFDALFCANDMLAIGALKALNEKHIKVPEDVGVVGFDDINLASYIEPALTTIRQPIYELGRKSAEVLLNMITHVEGGKVHQLDVSLQIRNTTKNN